MPIDGVASGKGLRMHPAQQAWSYVLREKNATVFRVFFVLAFFGFFSKLLWEAIIRIKLLPVGHFPKALKTLI